MKYFKLLFFFLIFIYLNYQTVDGAINKPLSTNETSVAISILKSLYNIDTNTFEEVCDYNGCFECTQITQNSYVVTSINMVNSSNSFIVSQDLSVFKNLIKLIIGENVQLPTSFFNETLPQLKKLENLEISNQEQPFPDKFVIPNLLSNVHFLSISVPLSPIWFESSVNSIFVVKTLPGFKYPNLTNENTNVRGLSLALNHIDSNVPSMNLFPNLQVIIFKIYNDMSQEGYKNFSIDSINQEYIRVNSLEFSFINSGNDATIQKFTLQQSLISRFKLKLLEFVGIGFTLDPSIGYLNFSMMSDYGLILTINGTCDLVIECKVSNCIVLPTVVPPKTSSNKIDIVGCITPSLTPNPTNSSQTTTTTGSTTTGSTTTIGATTSNPTKPPIDNDKTSTASYLSFSFCQIFILILCLFSF
ncbi:hypothetical protein ACTFIZ_010852 [Dictyostelium cf. discoideum]